MFFKLYKWYQIVQNSTYGDGVYVRTNRFSDSRGGFWNFQQCRFASVIFTKLVSITLVLLWILIFAKMLLLFKSYLGMSVFLVCFLEYHAATQAQLCLSCIFPIWRSGSALNCSSWNPPAIPKLCKIMFRLLLISILAMPRIIFLKIS